VFNAHAEEVRLGIWYRRWGGGQKNENGTATGRRKKFDDVYSRLDTMHESDRQADGHRATAKTALTHSVAR